MQPEVQRLLSTNGKTQISEGLKRLPDEASLSIFLSSSRYEKSCQDLQGRIRALVVGIRKPAVAILEETTYREDEVGDGFQKAAFESWQRLFIQTSRLCEGDVLRRGKRNQVDSSQDSAAKRQRGPLKRTVRPKPWLLFSGVAWNYGLFQAKLPGEEQKRKHAAGINPYTSVINGFRRQSCTRHPYSFDDDGNLLERDRTFVETRKECSCGACTFYNHECWDGWWEAEEEPQLFPTPSFIDEWKANGYDGKIMPEMTKRQTDTIGTWLLVNDQQTLQRCIAEILDSQYPILAVDVEHSSLSYRGFTSLVQLSTYERDYIIDPFPFFRAQSDLPFRELNEEVFADPRIVKVLHDCRRDAMWLQRDCGLYLVNVFDTFVACYHLPQISRKGYKDLVTFFLNIEIPKEEQNSNWSVRPLSDEQLSYARTDTRLLLHMFPKIVWALHKQSGEPVINNNIMDYLQLREYLQLRVHLASTEKAEKVYQHNDISRKSMMKELHRHNLIGTINELDSPAFRSAAYVILRQWTHEVAGAVDCPPNKILLAQEAITLITKTRTLNTESDPAWQTLFEKIYQEFDVEIEDLDIVHPVDRFRELNKDMTQLDLETWLEEAGEEKGDHPDLRRGQIRGDQQFWEVLIPDKTKKWVMAEDYIRAEPALFLGKRRKR